MTILEREVIELKVRVERLEALVHQLVGQARQGVPAGIGQTSRPGATSGKRQSRGSGP